MHKLLVLNFYPFLQKYIAPHQRDVTQARGRGRRGAHRGTAGALGARCTRVLGSTSGAAPHLGFSPLLFLRIPPLALQAMRCVAWLASLCPLLQVLAALVQAVHELVPPETLQPVLRQLVDQFVHDRWAPLWGGAIARSPARFGRLAKSCVTALGPRLVSGLATTMCSMHTRTNTHTHTHTLPQGAARGDCGGPEDSAGDVPQVPPAHGPRAAAGEYNTEHGAQPGHPCLACVCMLNAARAAIVHSRREASVLAVTWRMLFLVANPAPRAPRPARRGPPPPGPGGLQEVPRQGGGVCGALGHRPVQGAQPRWAGRALAASGAHCGACRKAAWLAGHCSRL